MIRANEIVPVATVNKTHGIHGELSVTVDPDVELAEGACVITDVDGIFVPFFVAAVRRRSADTFLVRLDGVDSDAAAAPFVGAELYVRADELTEADADDAADDEADDDADDAGGFYAAMLIGSTLADTDGTVVGTIEGIDTSTPNTLLLVDRPDGTHVMAPLASDLIAGYDRATSTLTMDLPAGLLDI